jgi:hypothetical protein
MGKEHAWLPIDELDDHAFFQDLVPQGFAQRAWPDLQQPLGQRQQVSFRQATIAILHRLQQGVGDAGSSAQHRGLRNTEPLSELVGRLEAYAGNVARQTIGVLPHQWHRIGTVGLEDAHRASRADAVALQEHHDLANGLLLAPAGRDALKTRLADAVDLEQALGRALNHVENGFTKAVTSLPAKWGPIPLIMPEPR